MATVTPLRVPIPETLLLPAIEDYPGPEPHRQVGRARDEFAQAHPDSVPLMLMRHWLVQDVTFWSRDGRPDTTGWSQPVIRAQWAPRNLERIPSDLVADGSDEDRRRWLATHPRVHPLDLDTVDDWRRAWRQADRP